jgi:hypothetical protein
VGEGFSYISCSRDFGFLVVLRVRPFLFLSEPRITLIAQIALIVFIRMFFVNQVRTETQFLWINNFVLGISLKLFPTGSKKLLHTILGRII